RAAAGVARTRAGVEAAWLPLRRAHDRIRVHAGNGVGERPARRLRRPGRRRVRARGVRAAAALGTAERGGPLVDERSGALEEVVGPSECVLELGLEMQLRLEVAVDEPVERLLGARV